MDCTVVLIGCLQDRGFPGGDILSDPDGSDHTPQRAVSSLHQVLLVLAGWYELHLHAHLAL